MRLALVEIILCKPTSAKLLKLYRFNKNIKIRVLVHLFFSLVWKHKVLTCNKLFMEHASFVGVVPYNCYMLVLSVYSVIL